MCFVPRVHNVYMYHVYYVGALIYYTHVYTYTYTCACFVHNISRSNFVVWMAWLLSTFWVPTA